MIIDFHTHAFPDTIAEKAITKLSKAGNIQPYSNGTIDGLLESMEKNGVDLSINLPVATNKDHTRDMNKFWKLINDRCEKIISFAAAHPDAPDIEGDIYYAKYNKYLGIKIHPDYQGTFIDDEKYVKLLSEAKKNNLITVVHAGYDVAFPNEEIKCTPKRVLNLLDKLGGYDKLVLAHLGGNELFSQVYTELAGEDVYFDTSYVLPFTSRENFEKLLLNHCEDKILFASDSPWQDQGNMINIIKGYSLKDVAERKIFSENAKKLLNIR